jgi:FeS assembly SUF system protein
MMSDDMQNRERNMIDLSAPPEPPAQAPEESGQASVGAGPDLPQAEIERITHDVIAALKSVHDPEIPADIYELGLIYQVDLEAEGLLKVEMTLTAPGCPVAGEMPIWVKDACETVDGVDKADVTLTFDPPWTPDRMSEEAKLMLNML